MPIFSFKSPKASAITGAKEHPLMCCVPCIRIYLFLDSVLFYNLGFPGILYMSQAGLKLETLFPQFPECYICKSGLPLSYVTDES